MSSTVLREAAGTPAGGQFASHDRAEGAASLSRDFDPAPLDASDMEFATEGACGLVAGALHRLTGWELRILCTDGEGWVHACVITDRGQYIDATGASTGRHIIDDQKYYDAFEPEDVEDAEPDLHPSDLEWVEFFHDKDSPETRARANRIAATLAEWAVERGHGSAAE